MRGERGRRLVVWRLFHLLFISQVVKFIYQLSILCFVSSLYAQYKVTINSIWDCVKKKKNLRQALQTLLTFVFV